MLPEYQKVLDKIESTSIGVVRDLNLPINSIVIEKNSKFKIIVTEIYPKEKMVEIGYYNYIDNEYDFNSDVIEMNQLNDDVLSEIILHLENYLVDEEKTLKKILS
jgi:hypothetical protein